MACGLVLLFLIKKKINMYVDTKNVYLNMFMNENDRSLAHLTVRSYPTLYILGLT